MPGKPLNRIDASTDVPEGLSSSVTLVQHRCHCGSPSSAVLLLLAHLRSPLHPRIHTGDATGRAGNVLPLSCRVALFWVVVWALGGHMYHMLLCP